jgi:CDP-diacylglycerol--serine O-phosphatidyltransferase
MKNSRRAPFRAYILPTLFTTANLVLGCLCVAFLFDRGEDAALVCTVLIFAAAVTDALDGLVARATGGCSRFGMEFDSMADLVSFGVAPAWLAYVYCLKSLWPVGVAACIWYVTCAAFRLARFNAQVENRIKGFSGLPSPAAAATVASFVILMETLPRLSVARLMPSQDYMLYSLAPWVSGMMALLGWLMISRTPYLSLKGFDLTRPRPIRLVVAAVVLGFVIFSLPWLLFAIFLLYVFAGLIAGLLIRVRWLEVVVPAWVEWAERVTRGEAGGRNSAQRRITAGGRITR